MSDASILQSIHNRLPELQRAQNVLMFSAGADSIASYFRMLELGIKPEGIVYMEYIPGLHMVESYLRYFEDFTGQKITRIYNTLFWEAAINGFYQKPGLGARHFDALSLVFEVPKKKSINDEILECFTNPFLAIGIRVSDGIFRAKKLRNHGAIDDHKREWYPVADMTISEVASTIKKSGIKLPIDYRIHGRSFESIRHSNAEAIRDSCPKTWAQICEFFPMAPLLIHQQHLVKKNSHLQSRRSIFASMAFENEDCI